MLIEDRNPSIKIKKKRLSIDETTLIIMLKHSNDLDSS
jgi:hypothetical protein